MKIVFLYHLQICCIFFVNLKEEEEKIEEEEEEAEEEEKEEEEEEGGAGNIETKFKALSNIHSYFLTGKYKKILMAKKERKRKEKPSKQTWHFRTSTPMLPLLTVIIQAPSTS